MNKKNLIPFIIIAVVIIGLYFLKFGYWDCIKNSFEKLNFKEFIESLLSSDKSVWGTFGDYVGGILNPLFSFAALLAIVHTIELQNKQIKDTKEEVEIQRFEKHFFQMLDLFNNIKREIVLLQNGTFSDGNTEDIDVRFKGMELLIKLSNELLTSKFNSRYDINDKNVVKNLCNDFYNFYRGTFEHYFHTLYRLIKFVDNNNIENKEFYSDIVCISLSDAEVNLLFYYCSFLDTKESDDLLELVKKYNLLKYFTDPKKHRELL